MKIIIEPQENLTSDDGVERRCLLSDVGSGAEKRAELWFRFNKQFELPSDEDCDSYLLASIMNAMKLKKSIHVKGSVSAHLLGNLVEYQSAWAKWLPEIYSQVDVTCDHVRETEHKMPGSICAFSGGVDASFSVWRHSQNKWSHRSKYIKLCAMVHGFDIPLVDEVAFTNAATRAENTLDDLSIPLFEIKTNYRTLSKVSWEHSFLCALVAALNNLKSQAGTCVVGSSEPYDSLVIPWGSSPITDYLLSSGDFEVIHDGASHSRTEKVGELLDWNKGVENLRVCWQGELKDRNCGRCEKCVRTKLNFLATGHDIPTCFPTSDIIEDMKHIRLSNDVVRAEWLQIYHHAKANNIDSPWVRHAWSVVNRRSLTDRLLPKGSLRREAAKRIIGAFGPR